MRDYVRLLDWLRSSQNACYLYGCDECPADCENHEGDIFKDAADAIEELVAAVPKWISVEERLPDEDMEVLILYRYKDGEGDTNHVNTDITTYGQMYFGGREVEGVKHWRQPFEYFSSNYEVVAWMLLPDPPKENT